MAEVATPVVDGGAADKKKVVNEKPEKPDEATYKESVAKAEKEHQASLKKLVCRIMFILKTSMPRQKLLSPATCIILD